MSTPTHVDEWTGENVRIGDIERALSELRETSAGETAGPDVRMRVMNHIAWIPEEWIPAAMDTFAGLAERLPSRGILLIPEPDAAEDSLAAKASVLAFSLPGQDRHLATEVIELRLRGRRALAPASVVTPLLVSDLPVFLRWRGRPPFGERPFEELVGVTDRLVLDSAEWADPREGYAELPGLFDRVRVSDIAWRRTLPWRLALAGLWPEISTLNELRVVGPLAEALLLAGWLRSRLNRAVELVHEEAEQTELVAVDGEPCTQSGNDAPSPSDLLSEELDAFSRDRIYEEAVPAAGY